MFSNNLEKINMEILGGDSSKLVQFFNQTDKLLNTVIGPEVETDTTLPDLTEDSSPESNSSFFGFLDRAIGPTTETLWRRNLHRKIKRIGYPEMPLKSKTIIFFPTNGVGLGHFSRLYAIAHKIRQSTPSLGIVFVTSAPTEKFLTKEGIIFHQLPDKLGLSRVSTTRWDSLLNVYLRMLMNTYCPHFFIFDGTYPYHGLLSSLKKNGKVSKVWVQRQTARPLKNARHKVKVFDQIVNPTDSTNFNEVSESPIIPTITCEPIICVEDEELLPKKVVREHLGIPNTATIVYLQLGAGVVNEINGIVQVFLNELIKHKELHVVMGGTILNDKNMNEGERIQTLRDYPNSIYYRGFDFAILAGGYNSYHESIHFGLPTICVPNLETQNDDQLARVKVAERHGAMLVLTEINKESVQKAILSLMKADMRELMRQNQAKLKRPNGAEKVAKILVDAIYQRNNNP